MIWLIIKKQGLIFRRNPAELVLLLALPMLLIVILSLSLGSFFNSSETDIHIKAVLIDEGDTDAQLEAFTHSMQEENISKEEQREIVKAAERFHPVKIFKEDVLQEMDEMVQVQTIKPKKKPAVIKNNDYTAVIEIPEDFLLKTWQHIFLDEEDTGTWHIEYSEEAGTEGTVLKGLINKYQEQLTLSEYALSHGKDPETIQFSSESFGEASTLNDDHIVNTKDYYTIGMAVMNVLFMASAISSFAFMEKEKHIFNRIILANVTGRTYFSGIFISTSVFAFLQLLIIFAFSWLVFDVRWDHLGMFLAITGALACTVGGMAAVLSIIAYRIESETIINMFGSIIVSVLAFVGGSFFPIGDFSSVIRTLGDYTPNGAAMGAYLEVLKGNTGMDIWRHVLILLSFSVLLLGIAIGFYPKRGQQQ